jgi:uncharacterized protein affecting Mg2+/Co2+ transport
MTAADSGSSASSGSNAWRRDTEALSSSMLDADDDAPPQLPEIVAPEMKLSPPERIALWDEIAASEPKLQAAIDASDFSTAAELRERITALKAQDPYFGLRDAFDGAIVREDYFSAAKYKLQLDKLGAPPGMLRKATGSIARGDAGASSRGAAAASGSESTPVNGVSKDGKSTVYTTKSDTTTNGVRIEVRSHFYPEQSNPMKDQYIFIYRVKISNGSAHTVQLVSRKWDIRSVDTATGKPVVQEVKGPGVVGQQPVLEPGQSFEYSSACPIFHGPKDDFRVVSHTCLTILSYNC